MGMTETFAQAIQMHEAESTAYLVVLSGMRKGARVDLEDGRYVVGSSEECDIFFNEPGVPEQYFELLVSRERIVITPISSVPVTVDNDSKIGVDRVLTKPSVISIGDVNVLVSPLLRKTKARRSKGNRKGHREVEEQSPQETVRWETMIPLMVLGVLIAVFLLTKLVSAFSPNDGELASLPKAVSVQQGIADKETGFAKSGQALEAERTGNEEAHYQQLNRKDSVKNILEALGYPDFTVELASDGVVEISGYVASKKNWESHKPLLMQDLPWITKLDDSGLESLLDRKERLHSELASNGLDKKVTISVRTDELVLLGALNQSQSTMLNNLIRTWDQTYKGKPEVKNRTRVAATEVRGLDVMAVSITDVPLVTLRDGSKYAIGAMMPGGYLLKDISIEQLTLKRNNEDLTLTLGSK